MSDMESDNYDDSPISDLEAYQQHSRFHNQPFDEAVEVDASTDAESMESPARNMHGSPTRPAPDSPGQFIYEGVSPPDSENGYSNLTEDSPSPDTMAMHRQQQQQNQQQQALESMDMSSTEMMLQQRDMADVMRENAVRMQQQGIVEEEEEEEDYSHPNAIPLTQDLRMLFRTISSFQPETVGLDAILKPFVQEYIPAVGDIDPFLKIPRPDGKPDPLGLMMLDEPSLKQSDPSVLELELAHSSKEGSYKPTTVRSVEDANSNPRKVQDWIDSISRLHKSKALPTVHYTKNMPDIEQLMQIWPPELEDLLQSMDLPGADLDVDVETYARIVCGLLDIPVYTNIIESLHVLFTLFSEFRANQHFQSENL